MSFFGLTQLGYQDTIREHLKEPELTPQYIYRSGLYRDKSVTLPPIKKDLPQASIVPIDQLSGYGPGHRGSHNELVRMQMKHIRNPKASLITKLKAVWHLSSHSSIQDIYRRPVISSAEVAKWRKDEPLKEREPWSTVKRHIKVDSEMTRFVKEMHLTNREFSLY
ncbi:hypothetical protein CAPTEDRAFT_226928 [Capitella teleta]|uniref:Uncharacterized protein n=1 Tax=Capitella teleta TaxID=283909 RepID=R7U9R3_CAPTE|nr:hypothetical protein CAPTEDRAFT_226928 [Capitella teleta]|eukprot:ELT99845.1 hypothetical protein CAPTEDRAFT_226928 [Capitella teleta]